MASPGIVYGLVDPTSRLIIYVGQSRQGMRRPRAHARKGWVFEIVVLEVVENPLAQTPNLCPWLPDGRNQTALHEAERWWIAYGRASGWPLRNKTSGGESTDYKHTTEQAEKISRALRGRSKTPEHQTNWKAAIAKRQQTPRQAAIVAALAERGRQTSPQIKAAISERVKQIVNEPQRKKQLAAQMRERWQDPKSAMMMTAGRSQRQRLRWQDPVYRDHMSRVLSVAATKREAARKTRR